MKFLKTINPPREQISRSLYSRHTLITQKQLLHSILKLYLDFEPCDDCKTLIKEISESDIISDEQTKEEESTKFLRHLTYNHSEVVKAIIKDMPVQKRRQEFDWFK